MIRISDLFRQYAEYVEQHPIPEEVYQQGPPVVGAYILLEMGYDEQRTLDLINIATAFGLWWAARKRVVWRLREQTAEYLRRVNLMFVPETPPATWSGDVMLIESIDTTRPLYDDVFSAVAYKIKVLTTQENRYYYQVLTTSGGMQVFSIRCNAMKIDSGERINEGIIMTHLKQEQQELQHNPKYIQRALATVKFIFAASYYAMDPIRTEISVQPGPRQPQPRGTAKRNIKSKWYYQDMSIRYMREQGEGYARGESHHLDKSHLRLDPVLVAPYIRMQNNKAIIVDSHHSHRWKRQDREVIGEKIRI